MSASPARCSTPSSDLLSIAATIRASTPCSKSLDLPDLGLRVVVAVDQLGLVTPGLQTLDDALAVGEPPVGGPSRHGDADGATLGSTPGAVLTVLAARCQEGEGHGSGEDGSSIEHGDRSLFFSSLRR